MAGPETVVCFIDDDIDEVEAFRNVFSEDFTVVADTDHVQAIGELNEKSLKANLFVLDMYFSTGRENTDAERNRMVELKAEVDAAQNKLFDYLNSIDQSRNGGIAVMKYIQQNYPATPIVFYTRKGTLDDANVCIGEGAEAVIPKAPVAAFDSHRGRREQIEQALRDHHEALRRKFASRASSAGTLKKIGKLVRLTRDIWPKL